MSEQYAEVVIVEYDPAWPVTFETIAARIRGALGDRARDVIHVGSTSVPGLAANPIIDVNLLVDDTRDEASYVPAMEHAGFEFRLREPEWFEHRLMRGTDQRANIHIFPVGCVESGRMVRFRNWLRSHDDDRALYERTKRELAARKWRIVQDYADAKTDVVAEIMARIDAAG